MYLEPDYANLVIKNNKIINYGIIAVVMDIILTIIGGNFLSTAQKHIR